MVRDIKEQVLTELERGAVLNPVEHTAEVIELTAN